jgi:hypothetical protein
MKRRDVMTLVAVGAGAGFGLAWGLAWVLLDDPDNPADQSGESIAATLESPATVTIEGRSAGLIRPGVMVPLDLSFDNPNDHSVILDEVTVTVTGIDAPRADDEHPCAMEDFVVRQFSGSLGLVLDGDSVSTLSDLDVAHHDWPAIGMRARPVNQDGCKDAVISLGYQASRAAAQP